MQEKQAKKLEMPEDFKVLDEGQDSEAGMACTCSAAVVKLK